MSEDLTDGPPIDSLVELARSQDWDAVDGMIAGQANDPNTLTWATSIGLYHPDADLRDLAASIFEASATKLSDQTQEHLKKMVANDEHPYARFRAAFALAKRGDNSSEVTATLQEALKDEDVAEIAQKYLDDLKS